MKIKEKRFVSYQINCIGLFHAISFKNKNVNGFLHTFYMINLVSWFGVGLICLFGVKLLPPLLLWVFKYHPYFKLTNLFLILWSMSPLQCKSFLKWNNAAIGMDNMKNKCPNCAYRQSSLCVRFWHENVLLLANHSLAFSYKMSYDFGLHFLAKNIHIQGLWWYGPYIFSVWIDFVWYVENIGTSQTKLSTWSRKIM